MDRLLMKRSLVALSGLALVMASSGCRDRNLQVPPPAHYSDGGMTAPGTAPYAGPGPDATAIDPATLAPYSDTGYAPAGSYDPAASPTAGTYDPSAAAGAYSAYGNAGDADPTSYAPGPATGTYDPAATGAVYPSASSPSSFAATPYDPSTTVPGGSGMPTQGEANVQDFGGPYGNTPLEVPGFGDGVAPPPIPGELPSMP